MSGNMQANSRGLGWVLRYLAIPLSLIVMVMMWEFIASQTMDERGQFRVRPPSIMLGESVGRLVTAELRGQQIQEAERAQLVADAQMRGQLQAENALRPALERQMQAIRVEYETRLQTTVNAYASLYERYNSAARALYEMEAVIVRQQQQVAAGGMAGGTMAAIVGDLMCAIGNPQGCQAATSIRRGQTQELASLGQVGSIVPRNLIQQVEDPASLVARFQQPTMPPQPGQAAQPRVQQVVAQPAVTVPAPTPAPTETFPAGGTVRRFSARAVSSNAPFSFQLGSNGRVLFFLSSGGQAWGSYTDEAIGNDRRICFRFDNGNRTCKRLSRRQDGTYGWFDTEGARAMTAIIDRIE